jgi:hypothetical protein
MFMGLLNASQCVFFERIAAFTPPVSSVIGGEENAYSAAHVDILSVISS